MIGLPTADDVLAFWFGTAPITAPRAAWFDKSEAFDADVRARFLPLWEALCTGNADSWMDTPLEAIARIVVLDQFPRNMFRAAPRAFASDAAALHTARIVVAAGWDAELPTRFHRMFCYLPFEHSEALAVQDESVRLFTRLRDQEGDADSLVWAHKHRDIIARFGRFPHRNAVLGRVSTPEEIVFLTQPGASF
ncbi:DUF924 family protein [Ralstonia solanacearum]|uniref:DUF924 domain-containing protein n=1 Tax=Ralstonia solanacearum TaxID=305 RepID=A0AAD0S609_RALSL|nr:DUF924 family protein [Ralstonia solanacearum]AXV81151.1 DUF924 domain-containing protein [Ralstonia solanacearum]AXW52292.1 DUF924 domain-containing protein [Ralstonia solanacearum]CBJ50700.1 conserved protein of unknown function, DUF924 domain [Ralstonia solanacearum PSI07]